MNRMHTRWLAAAAVALFAVGCAQSNGDISYVQPNYLKKKDLLDGVWYIRNTVTRTPSTTGFTFAGETGDMEKVVFDIQEDHLVAYRSYAQIPGQDNEIDQSSKPSGTTTTYCETDVNGKRTCTPGRQYYGNPVFVWPITKHFDVQRGYNPATGEETNVISENASDRPWNEREYVRVNWTAQQASWSLGTFGIINPKANSDFSGMIYANEPGTDDYDWPRQEFQDVNGEQKMKYLEFTGRYMARPDTYYFREYGVTYPLCYFSSSYGGHTYDCTASQIEMRTSIAKVDPNQTLDYEPLVYDNKMMAKFGYFRTERLNYDRRFGLNESDVLYLANRHRIWKSSYNRDSQGNVDWNSPIPMDQREAKPIVYYVTPADRIGGQAEYQKFLEAGRIVEKNWDKAFRRAVAAAQGKGDDWQSVPQMMFVCENPVPAGAPAACGVPGFEARFGDLRYNFLWTHPEAVPNGLLGYGPSSADPETGEIISANSNTYSAAVARSAQHTLDIVNALTGDLTIEELVSGQDVKDYMLSHPSYAAVQGKVAPLKSELQGDAVQKTELPSQGAFLRATPKMSSIIGALKSSGGLPTAGGDRLRAAAEKLRQHPMLESAILDNPEMATDALTLLPPQLAAEAEHNPAAAREALRTALLRTPELYKLERARQDYFARKNMCFTAHDYEDRPMLGLAFREANRRTARITQLQAEGQTPAAAREIADREIRDRFQQSIWRATTEHELGHTIGLRHNFQASFDAVNYFDGYWDLKKQTLYMDQNGQLKMPRTPADLKAASDGTLEQLYGGMHDHEYSSIMDYGGKANADWQGVGKYDEAAILFAYSGDTKPGYVEVFTANLPLTNDRQFDGTDGKKVTVTGAGYDLPVVNALKINTAVPNYTERFHYSTVPLHFGTGNDLQEAVEVGIQNLRKRTVKKWSEVEAGHERVRQILKSKPTPTVADIEGAGAALEVPYMFCTDDHVGYILSCNRWDRGPDYYEMNRTTLESYWNGYFFRHFRRDRYAFSTQGALYGAFGTFLDTGAVHKHWTYAMYGASGPNSQNVPSYVNTPFGYDASMQDTWTMATLDGINELLRVMSIPPAGFYMLWTPADTPLRYDNGGQPRWDVISEGVDFDNLSEEGQANLTAYYTNYYGAQAFVTLPRGYARRMYSRYDYKSGFGFWNRLSEVGHYNDQIGALFATTDSYASFLGVDRVADQNRYSISYYTTFRDELNDVFGALWALDEPKVRPFVYLDTETFKKPTFVFPSPVKGEKYIEGFDYPNTMELSEAPAGTFAAPTNVQTTWTSRIYSLFLGMATFTNNFDLDYAKRNQVFKLGSGQDLTPPAGWEKVEITDPFSGTRYAALRNVNNPEETPAIRMILTAQDYLDVMNDPTIVMLEEWQKADQSEITQTRAEYTEAFKDQLRNLDLMQGYYSVFGTVF